MKVVVTRICLGIAIAVTLACTGIFYWVFLQYYGGIDAYIYRAQVAPEIDGMYNDLETVKANMEKLNVTEGYFALVKKTADKDLSSLYWTVVGLLDRLDAGKKEILTFTNYEVRSNTYAVTLYDIRAIIPKLPLPAWGITMVKYWWFILIIIGAWTVYGVVGKLTGEFEESDHV
jgi:hypothetical protein